MSISKTDSLCFSLRVVNVKKLSMRASVCHSQTWGNLYAWQRAFINSVLWFTALLLMSKLLYPRFLGCFFFCLKQSGKYSSFGYLSLLLAGGLSSIVSVSHSSLEKFCPIFSTLCSRVSQEQAAHCLPPRNLWCISNAWLHLNASSCVNGQCKPF